MKSEKNSYERITGSIAGGSVGLVAVILVFGGNAGVAIGGVAILCAFGILMALMHKSSCSCDCDKEESKSVSVRKKAAKTRSNKVTGAQKRKVSSESSKKKR